MMNEGYQSVTSLLRNLARIGILGGVAIIFVSFPGAIVGADESTNRASQACYVQVELTYWADLRRGPSYNYGVKRRIPSEQELRVLARDESGDWFQAHLGDPWNKIGWLRNENLQFYGRCWDLPVVSDPAAYEPENATPAPTEVPLPAFARGMDFVPDDRMFLLNDGMLYVRHEANDLRVHIVIADLANPQLDVHTALALTEDKRLGWVSDLARETGAFVALNGDFYASNFLPQGFMLVEGEVVTAPKHRATFAITADHEPFIGYFTDGWTWDAQLVTSDEEAHPLQLWNLPCAEDWLCVHTDFWDELPRQQGYDGLHVLISPTGRVMQVTTNEPVPIPADHLVVRAAEGTEAAEWLLENLIVGDEVTFQMETDPDWQDYEFAISGGPIVVREGAFWQECDPEVSERRRICEEFNDDFRASHYGNARIPRAGIGHNPEDNVLILVMAEGNGVYGSQGITHQEFADIFIRLGAETAMEFDGGRSASMWVWRNNVNGFAEGGERHVTNALLLFWDAED